MNNTGQSVEELKQAILQKRLQKGIQKKAAEIEAARLRPADRSKPLPLSWAQQRLWFLAQLDPAAGFAYHMPAALRLEGRLNGTALKAALDRIVARHEDLRTTFAGADGQPVQVIGPADTGFALAKHDLIELRGHEQRAAIDRIAADEAATPFDLEQGPLIRGQLLRLAEQEHILLVTQHHIVSDGWSTGVLVREFSALYAAFSQGQDDPLPPLAIQYADYAAWQREWLSGAVLQQQIDYWKSHLAGAPALLELPTDRPRPAQQSYAGGRCRVALPASVSAGLRTLSQRHGTTLFMTLLAGWSALLSRLSGQQDIVVGTPVANRQRSEVEPLIGFFVNTLALRLNLEDEPSVAQLLARAKACALGAYGHQDLPFEQVVEALKPPRSLSHSPIFQTMLSLNNTPAGGELALPGVTLSVLEAEHASAQFDLSLALSDGGDDSGGEIGGELTYASDLFDATTAQRIADCFATLLAGMAADEDTPVGRLPLLTEEERARVLTGFNATTKPYPRGLLVHQLFEQQVRKTPQAIAVTYEDHSLGYDELNRRANRLAHRLIGLGIRPDDRVALCAERSLEMVIGLLGILKAGAAYVPLDPGYPQERLDYMLADCAPAAVLAQAALQERLRATPAPLLALEDEPIAGRSEPAEHDPDPAALGVTERHLAYVIYTSGSTGQPKGAMNQHDGVVNRLLWAQDAYRLGADDRVLQKTPFSFDVSVWEFFLPLLAGARLVMARPGGHQDPHYLQEAIERQGVTTMHFVPSMLQAFLEQARPEQCRTLRQVLCSGEALPYALQQRFLERLPGVELHNLYGPTEAAVDVTAWRCDTAMKEGIVPIGAPIANLRIHILDRLGQAVPVGVAGEIHIGGIGVGRGYLNRPELTAERFIADPFAEDAQARLYKTGDLGRWLADGTIEYLGRNDFQVKLRGLRIELGEIEAKLNACTGVREAVVLAREDQPGDKRLVAYVIAQEGQALTALELRSQLQPLLPEYMVPGAFVVLDKLPLTPNGKVDRKALPAPDGQAVAAREYEAPQGEAEAAIAAVWCELLGVERVGRHDNFFELGGHSLMVIKVIERLRQRGFGIDVRSVFMHPVLAELAPALRAGTSRQAAPIVPPNRIASDCTRITPDLLPLIDLSQEQIDRIVAGVPDGVSNVQDIYPLVPFQEGILFHHLLDTEGDAYLLRTVLVFDEQGRMDAFLDALRSVIDRHDILRSAVLWKGLPAPVQVVCREAPLPVTALPCHAGEDALGRLLEATDPRRHRLDLQRAPLIAAHTAVDAASGACYLALLNHHIVSDHVTLEIIIEEIEALLEGRGAALPRPLPYRDYVAQALAVPPAAHEAYFREQLGDIEETTAPFGVLAVDGNGERIAEAHQSVPDETARAIRRCAREYGVAPAVLFHVAWAQVLARCTGRDDVVFGTVLSGRLQGQEGAGQILGMFINTLPIRMPLGAMSVAQAVAATRRRLGELLEHEQASLALAQRCSGVAAGMPLFTTLLNYRHNRGARDEAAAFDAAPAAEPAWCGARVLRSEERTNYPISIAVDDFGAGFGVTAQCDGVDPARIAAYLGQAIEQLVAALTGHPERPLAELDILSASERARVLVEWNATARDYPRAETLQTMFESRAARDPERIALMFGESRLTYRELNARANRLAHYLRGRGVGPDVLVGLCVERSIEMMVGLLGILKAGGAYVPLDPAYPRNRLAHMLDDAKPAVLLTQEKLLTELPDGGIATFCLDTQWSALADLPDGDPPPASGPRDLAYVIYTSGSTGKPKGVAVLQSGLVNFLHAMRERPGIAEHDALLSVTSLSFDIAALELFLPLVAGARAAIATREAAADPWQLKSLVERMGITMMQATPSTWRMLADNGWPATPAPLKLLCGGEALPADLAAKMLRHVPEIWNMYGPTETTIWSAVHRITAERPSISIGGPIANTRIYILDGRLQPAPVGVAGELHIAGDGLARGYLHRPELTDEKFIPEPFAPVDAAPGARMYKTGDLARWLPDGSIEYLGRIDQQVKIHGHRIELGEIEAALQTHAAVGQAVVTAKANAAGDRQLVAYVVPAAAEGDAEPSIGMSLFYFGADSYDQHDKYKLYLESAKFADEHGFEAVWTPERHFHATGSLYPNPSILSAALATMTSRVHLRAGSVVLPLHSPLRVAEEWSVVDNLSRGRCGVAIASGWHPRDFVLNPQNFADRKQVMLDGIGTLRSLWAGQAVSLPDGAGGRSEVSIYPKPIQAELPLWVTAAGNPETFIQAGKLGVNVLTHLLGQTVEELAAQIALYRQARADNGHDPDAGKVTLMVHTYVGADAEETLQRAKEPFLRYMRSHLGLLSSVVKSLDMPVGDGSPENLERMVAFAFERYTRTASLIGTPQTCLPILRKLDDIGVDEVACLIDWMDSDSALQGLPALKQLMELARKAPPGAKALLEHLKGQVPDYMLPRAFVTLDRLPMTPNGKIDRNALPAPETVADAAVAERRYEAPQGPVEVAVARVWQELFGLPQIGRRDHFFELGGHSLLAVRLVARLRQALGIDIDLRLLIGNPALADFAAAINAPALDQRTLGMTPVRAEGSLRPLFIIHSGAGDSFYANDLAPWLDPELPIYSFTAQGYFNDEAPLATIAEMAASYVESIRALQPQGPYRVAGWSTGGTIAYEIAQQLIALGETVEFVGLIDAMSEYRPYKSPIAGLELRPDAAGEYDEIATLISEVPTDAAPEVKERAAELAAARDVEGLLALGREIGVVPAEYDMSVLRRLTALRNAIDNAAFKYALRPLAAPVTLFKATHAWEGDLSHGWDRVLGERLQVVAVPGDHLTMMEQPHIRELGGAMSRALAQAGRAAAAVIERAAEQEGSRIEA